MSRKGQIPDLTEGRANNQVFNVKDFGAKGDGNADETQAFRAAFAAADLAAQGPPTKETLVLVPPGKYQLRGRRCQEPPQAHKDS